MVGREKVTGRTNLTRVQAVHICDRYGRTDDTVPASHPDPRISTPTHTRRHSDRIIHTFRPMADRPH